MTTPKRGRGRPSSYGKSENWQPIKSAPTKGRKQIWLKVPGREPQIAYSDTWWMSGSSVECKPTHWRPARVNLMKRRFK